MLTQGLRYEGAMEHLYEGALGHRYDGTVGHRYDKTLGHIYRVFHRNCQKLKDYYSAHKAF